MSKWIKIWLITVNKSKFYYLDNFYKISNWLINITGKQHNLTIGFRFGSVGEQEFYVNLTAFMLGVQGIFQGFVSGDWSNAKQGFGQFLRELLIQQNYYRALTGHRPIDEITINGYPILIWLNNMGCPAWFIEWFKQWYDAIVCFLAGTKIGMADGTLKNIEDVVIGDLVQSYDPSSGQLKTGVVSKVFHHTPDEMTDYYLVINGDLRVTPNHPFFVNDEWIDAGDLKVGDVLSGNLITSIDKVFERVPTFNFEVEPYHTYSVIWGENARSIVHNMNMNVTNITVVGTKYPIAGGNNGMPVCCVPAGTIITMSNGTKIPIEQVKIGDYVLSYDFTQKILTRSTVTFIASPLREGVYEINGGLIRMTDDHPFYVIKQNGQICWAAVNPEKAELSYGTTLSISTLEIGDFLLISSGNSIKITSINYKPGEIKTYTLATSVTDGTGNFFANSVLLHAAAYSGKQLPEGLVYSPPKCLNGVPLETVIGPL